MRKRLLISLLLSVVATYSIQAQPVLAVARLVSSEPADGATVSTFLPRVRLVFSEAVTAESEVNVLDSGGRRINTSASRLDPNDSANQTLIVDLPVLVAGTYRVSWYTVSQVDNQPAEGLFSFVVSTEAGAGSSAAATPAPAAAATPAASVTSAATSVSEVTAAATSAPTRSIEVAPTATIILALPPETTTVALPETATNASNTRLLGLGLLSVLLVVGVSALRRRISK